MESFESVAIPPAVEIELHRLIPDWAEARPGFLVRKQLVEETEWREWVQADLLDLGEAQALALVRQMSADWFLTDDTAARLLATRMSIETHGSLGIVLRAAAIGSLPGEHARDALESLFESTLWIAPRVREEARKALEEILGAG